MFLSHKPHDEFLRNLLIIGYSLSKTHRPVKEYFLCLQLQFFMLHFKNKRMFFSEFVENLQEQLMEISSKKIQKSPDSVLLFYLLLTVFSFDQDILDLNSKFKPYIDQIPNRKCADLCRVYYSFVKFKGQRKKPRKLMRSINLCNLVIKRVGQFYHDDQDRWESH